MPTSPSLTSDWSVTVSPGNETHVIPSGLNDAITWSPFRISRKSAEPDSDGCPCVETSWAFCRYSKLA